MINLESKLTKVTFVLPTLESLAYYKPFLSVTRGIAVEKVRPSTVVVADNRFSTRVIKLSKITYTGEEIIFNEGAFLNTLFVILESNEDLPAVTIEIIARINTKIMEMRNLMQRALQVEYVEVDTIEIKISESSED
jgi:hypothetical protein